MRQSLYKYKFLTRVFIMRDFSLSALSTRSSVRQHYAFVRTITRARYGDTVYHENDKYTPAVRPNTFYVTTYSVLRADGNTIVVEHTTYYSGDNFFVETKPTPLWSVPMSINSKTLSLRIDLLLFFSSHSERKQYCVVEMVSCCTRCASCRELCRFQKRNVRLARIFYSDKFHVFWNRYAFRFGDGQRKLRARHIATSPPSISTSSHTEFLRFFRLFTWGLSTVYGFVRGEEVSPPAEQTFASRRRS